MLRSSSGLTCCCLAIALSLPGSWASAQDEPYSNTQGTANDYEFLLSLPTDGTGPEPAPWQGTLELNDTGVDDGSELRQWLSIQKMDLFAPLDFFAVDVSTDSFDQYHSLSLQYETAPLMNDLYLAFDALHSRDQIDAVETDDTLDDVTTGAGLYLMHLAYLDEWLVSAGPGIRWLEIETDKLRIYEGQGKNTFVLPGLQLRWQYQAAGHASSGYIHYEWNEPDAADTRRTERPARVPVNIGGNAQLIPVTASIDIDTRFQTLLLDYEHRLYLGPDDSPGHYQLVFNGL
ncbi:MAG: hypothetical protein R3208_06140, partial [Ketobacteraceae bacterium]|nr:hypothetical protein [Ketobacteraceae bacterium]